MEEINVGEYVRTDNGFIGKLIREDLSYPEPSEWILDVNGERIVIVEDVDYPVKHSFNIIDLIECSDILDTAYGKGRLHHKIDEQTILFDDNEEFFEISKKDIHSILTYEQYENNCYKLEDKE